MLTGFQAASVIFALTSAPPGSPGVAEVRDIPVATGELVRTTSVGSGQPVVLIPGLFGAAFSYRKIVAPLAKLGYRAVVVEPLGFGWSSHPRRANYSLAAQTTRVGAALDSLGLHDALIVANSTGASIALRLAYMRPDLVRGILSIDGGPAETAATPGLRHAMRFGGMLTKAVLDPAMLRSEVRKQIIENSGDSTWLTAKVVAGYTEGATVDLPGAIDAWQGMAKSTEPESLRARLGDCKVPVRLLIGGVPHPSAVKPDEIRLLGRELPDFRIDSVAHAGQYIHEEQPAAVLAAFGRLATLTHRAAGHSRP